MYDFEEVLRRERHALMNGILLGSTAVGGFVFGLMLYVNLNIEEQQTRCETPAAVDGAPQTGAPRAAPTATPPRSEPRAGATAAPSRGSQY